MLKKWLLMFARRFYQSDLQYVDKLIDKWVTNSIRWFIDLIIDGLFAYLALFGLYFLFPSLRAYIFLGDTFWHFPFAIILIGIVSQFFMKLIHWYQSNKKISRG